ncbi:MAG: phospholipase A [Oligoflexia bacterium]|nr:phospholipase A [Oligoflexia bacterium]
MGNKISLFIFLSGLFCCGAAYAAEGEPDLLSLHQYKPLYFLMGHPYTKIEISFKTQIVRDVPVYFAYTQLMMWDTFNPSPYFYDINYNPLAFYRFHFNTGNEQWLDVIPFEHESNGRGGALERSWNRTGLDYHIRQSLNTKTALYWDFKIWAPYYYNPNNPDLAQYRGLWELNLSLSQFMGDFFEFDDLIFRLYPGGESLTNPLHGGQELTLRLKAKFRRFLPLVIMQVFHGYAEDLLDYQDDRWGIRAGLGF